MSDRAGRCRPDRNSLGNRVRDNEPVRKLTTILSADAAEFSRMMRSDEEGTFRTLRLCRDAIGKLIGDHQGRVFNTAGDSVVAEFASPVEALRCAAEIQQAIEKVDVGLPESRRMRFRIGFNLGDVLVEGNDLIGDGVNVAARIQQAAKPGEICISAGVYELVKNQPDFSYDDLGGLSVKNIAEPVHVHRARRHPNGGRPPLRQRRVRAVLSAGGWAAVMAGVTAGTLGLAVYLGFVPLPVWQSRPGADGLNLTHASIAVLPFDNLTGDAAQDYFVDGITEDMTLALGRFSDLSVIAREAVQQYKAKSAAPKDISRELGVRYVLDGSVSRSGDRVRVKVELSDTVTGEQLWPGQYDGELKDVFAFQDDVTQNVVGALAIKISEIERQRSLAKPPENLQAYDYLQQGREYYRRNTRADNRKARELFERAIALDPNYASAYVALALSRLLTVTSGWTDQPAETLNEAERLARKALALDRANSQAHAALADVYLNRSQYQLALAEDDQAIALNPNDAFSHAARAGVLVFAGNAEEAVKSFEIATRLNPTMDIVRQYPIGFAYYLVKRYDEAARIMELGVRENPTDYFNLACLAASYAQLGRMDDAARAASGTLHAWPFFHVETFVSQFQSLTDRAVIRAGLRKAGLK
jgi:TolB-like protein/class 3 adenylate cyclase/Tfp pilus assembly protein PilF